MVERVETDRATPPPRAGFVRRLVRGLWRTVWRAGLFLAVVLVALTLVAKAITPASSLMLGRWATLQTVTRTVVPLEAVSPHVGRMIVTSEDARFCRHAGVDFEELRSVIEAGAARGASTLAMQTAKNVFLWPDRSYLRKAIEIPLALWIDAVWGKRRVFEIYVNVAEWGEGVFGIEAAAQTYFGKSAADLSRGEAALLATALPNPRGRNPASPSSGHRRLAQTLLAREAVSGELVECLGG